MLINLQCNECGKAFRVEQYRKNTARFCSVACKDKHGLSDDAKNKISMKVRKYYSENEHPSKGKKVSKPPKTDEHKMKISQSRKKYFKEHPDALKGANNPNWKGGTTNEHRVRLSNPEWKAIRKAIIKRDDYTCQECGWKPEIKRLHVHHITPWRYGGGDVDGNLISLCDKCHMKIEGFEFRLQKAITAKCVECFGGEEDQAECTSKTCPLYPYRVPFVSIQAQDVPNVG